MSNLQENESFRSYVPVKQRESSCCLFADRAIRNLISFFLFSLIHYIYATGRYTIVVNDSEILQLSVTFLY